MYVWQIVQRILLPCSPAPCNAGSGKGWDSIVQGCCRCTRVWMRGIRSCSRAGRDKKQTRAGTIPARAAVAPIVDAAAHSGAPDALTTGSAVAFGPWIGLFDLDLPPIDWLANQPTDGLLGRLYCRHISARKAVRPAVRAIANQPGWFDLARLGEQGAQYVFSCVKLRFPTNRFWVSALLTGPARPHWPPAGPSGPARR